jgi:ubiquitin-conjugating enzyme E2 G1
MSVLHSAGNDQFGYETAAERWLPERTMESVLGMTNQFSLTVASLVAMMHSPNEESPANVEAAVSFVSNLSLT